MRDWFYDSLAFLALVVFLYALALVGYALTHGGT